MRLSVCTITRNEETKMELLIRSVKVVADEVIVTDTGSTDRTVEIAAGLGAKVSSVQWQDDFSAARNFALDQATGDWVLWLNPDEELQPVARPYLDAFLNTDGALAYWVRVLELPQAARPDFFTETVQPRLFRRRPDVRFTGRLHPAFSPALEELAKNEGKTVPFAELTIRHHAYLSTVTEDKLRWAVRLLEKELKDRPGQLHFLIEYGRALLQLNDVKGHAVLAEAVDQVKRARNDKSAPSPTVGLLIEYLLRVSPGQSRSYLDKEEAAELARRWFPQTPPVLWAMAENAFRKEDFAQAASLLEQLVVMGKRGGYDRSAPFDPAIIGETAQSNLAICCFRLGQLDRAANLWSELLPSPRFRKQAQQEMARITLLKNQPDAQARGGS